MRPILQWATAVASMAILLPSGACATSRDIEVAEPVLTDIAEERHVVEPTPQESAALTRLDAADPGAPQALGGGATFVAGDIYTAASGQSCRSITLSSRGAAGETHSMLACRPLHGDGHWELVPNVLGGPP